MYAESGNQFGYRDYLLSEAQDLRKVPVFNHSAQIDVGKQLYGPFSETRV